jgi:two-component system response regulator HydG
LDRAVERRRWRRIEGAVRKTTKQNTDGKLVGRSAPMQALRSKIAKFAPADAPVLIMGETGTGKELVASLLHAQGRDPAAAFVPVNCAALPASTIDSFFFGHEKGAFTGAERARPGVFEEAEGGTLFLDEVNSLPLELQGRLLRVLQEKKIRRLGGNREFPVDFRLVCATNQSLEELVRKGQFREDLFFRISVLALEVPALRERISDLDELVAAMLPERQLSEGVQRLFRLHSWPGNVRELRNLLQAMDVLSQGSLNLDLEHLPESGLRSFSANEKEELSPMGDDLPGFVNEQESREREFLARAYRGAHGNVSRMARVLGVDRSHLHQKLVKLGVHQPKPPA